ncbi:MAG: LLM class flavin-dependent oxidoreductase [Actinomycetota bacterium]
MQLGVSLNSTHTADGPRLMIERARAAHRAGFASLSIGDRHAMPIPYVQNTPMLGRLLAEWPARPAGCLFLVPLWPPLLMAEQIGTLAATHDGPFIAQTGIGAGAEQFAAVGADLRTRGRVLEEAVAVVKALLAGETVDAPTFDMVGGKVGLRPDRPVEWWISAGVDRALERAARIGDVWYAAPTVLADDEGRRMLDHYRSAGGARAAIRKDALVLEDGDEARRLAAELVARGYRGMSIDALIVGDPDDAAAQLAGYAEAGFDELVIRCMTVPQEAALETLANLGPLAAG